MHSGFTEDKYVQFAEARPTDREHTHHILVVHPRARQSVVEGRADRRRVRSFERWQGGRRWRRIRWRIPGRLRSGHGCADAEAGTGEADQGRQRHRVPVALHRRRQARLRQEPRGRDLLEGEADRAHRDRWPRPNPKFAIPPGDANYQVDSKIVLQDDATLTMLLPHMHLRGKDFEFRVTYPDGKQGDAAERAALQL